MAPAEGLDYDDWGDELTAKAEVVAALTESMDHVRMNGVSRPGSGEPPAGRGRAKRPPP